MKKSIYRLLAGFRRFKEKYFVPQELENSVYRKLATIGQNPQTLMIGCSDSRVDPAILTDSAPGDIFVIRNVANLVPPYEASATGFRGTSSAIEFAVASLKVDNVIILGHRQCGGIRALISAPTENTGGFINQWMSIASEAREKVFTEYSKADEETKCRIAEMESLKISLRNLRSFPFVQEAIKTRQLSTIAVYFDLEQGELWEYDEESQKFRLLEV